MEKEKLEMDVLNVEEAAAYLKFSRTYLYRLAKEKKILADLLEPGSTVVLVTPIDGSAPKGRLILPQQLVLRELLDIHCTALVCQPEELPGALSALAKPPALVVTDSQAFGRVSKAVPETVPLTSFSISPSPTMRKYALGMVFMI